VFRRSDNPEGPVYNYNRNEIEMICMSNGVRTVNARPVRVALASPAVMDKTIRETGRGRYVQDKAYLNERQMKKVLTETGDTEIRLLLRKSSRAHALQPIGFMMIPAGTVLLTCLMLSNNTNSEVPMLAVPISMGVMVASGLIANGAKQRRWENTRKAVERYNEKY
jgi:hypothetical protein